MEILFVTGTVEGVGGSPFTVTVTHGTGISAIVFEEPLARAAKLLVRPNTVSIVATRSGSRYLGLLLTCLNGRQKKTINDYARIALEDMRNVGLYLNQLRDMTAKYYLEVNNHAETRKYWDILWKEVGGATSQEA